MRRARWMVAAALVAAGCMDFVPLSGPGDGVTVFLFLESRNPGPGAAADTLLVSGGVNALGIAFVDDTLRIAGRAIAPRGADGGRWGYRDTLVLPAGALSGVVPVRLPVPAGDALPLQEFGYAGVARAGPDTLVVRAGADVVLPIRTGGGTRVPELAFESWSVTLLRGRGTAEFRSTSPLPASIVIPASLVPADTAPVLEVGLRSQRAFRGEGRGEVHVSGEALLRWRVRILP